MHERAGNTSGVLAYLREMVTYCREQRRPDMVGYYEDAVQFVSASIFGELPPRNHRNEYFAPHDLEVNLEASPKTRSNQLAWQLATFVDPTPLSPSLNIRVDRDKCPLRKIVGRFHKVIKQHPVRYERLECGHDQIGVIGHEPLRARRRCYQCGQEKVLASLAKKKPSSVKVARSKEVSA
jgi:hypothetical protein